MIPVFGFALFSQRKAGLTLKMIDLLFIVNSIILGAGLAMDAFSVCLANGLHEPDMSFKRMCAVAGVYALFQAGMPLTGWVIVHTLNELLTVIQRIVPFAALVMLVFIGIKMIVDSVREKKGTEEGDKPRGRLTVGLLMTQAVATSIDALSVGLTIAGKGFPEAALSSGIIGLVTFVICLPGIVIGKKTGEKLKWRASLIGGIVLILVGIEIFVKNMFFS